MGSGYPLERGWIGIALLYGSRNEEERLTWKLGAIYKR